MEDLTREAAMEVRGTLRFDYLGRELDLESPWRHAKFIDLVSGATGEELSLETEGLGAIAERHEVGVHPKWGPGKVLMELYEKLVEPNLWNPTFVEDFPREVSPLARPHRSSPGYTEHFDLIVTGTEIGPAYSELTDPDEQRSKFEDQQRARAETGDEEAHPFDEDFLRALEYGMPPAGGLGYGIDRMLMILADKPSIRDVIGFPHLRPED
jgi:lysyl-tRNA synthetase class 2